MLFRDRIPGYRLLCAVLRQETMRASLCADLQPAVFDCGKTGFCKPAVPVSIRPNTGKPAKNQSVQVEVKPEKPVAIPALTSPVPKKEGPAPVLETPKARPEPPIPQPRIESQTPPPAGDLKRNVLPEIPTQQVPATTSPDLQSKPGKKIEDKPKVETSPAPPPPDMTTPKKPSIQTETREIQPKLGGAKPEPVAASPDVPKKADQQVNKTPEKKKSTPGPCSPVYPAPWCYPPPVCR